MPCKPTCGNETSRTGKSARESLLKIWTNIKGRSERFISVLLLSKEWTQFRLDSPTNGTTLSHRIKSIIWNISREVWHDPQLTPARTTYTLSVSTPSPPPLLSYFGFTPHCSLTQYSAFVSSTMVVGVDLNLYLVPSSCLLKVTVHTGVSVQRRDRCTGMQ